MQVSFLLVPIEQVFLPDGVSNMGRVSVFVFIECNARGNPDDLARGG